MDEDKVVKAIVHYQQNLEKYIERRNEAKMIYCMEKLQRLPITVSHLEQTGVGRTVNSVRKMKGIKGSPKNTAKQLVSQWKKMVTEEEDSEQEEDSDQEDDDDEDDSEDRLQIYCDDAEEKPREVVGEETRNIEMQDSSHFDEHEEEKYEYDKYRDRERDREREKYCDNDRLEFNHLDMESHLPREETRETRIVKHTSPDCNADDYFYSNPVESQKNGDTREVSDDEQDAAEKVERKDKYDKDRVSDKYSDKHKKHKKSSRERSEERGDKRQKEKEREKDKEKENHQQNGHKKSGSSDKHKSKDKDSYKSSKSSSGNSSSSSSREKESKEKESREKEKVKEKDKEKERDSKKEYKEKESRDKEYKEKELREKESREKEYKEKESKEKEYKEKELREKEYKEKESREKEHREKHKEKEEKEKKSREAKKSSSSTPATPSSSHTSTSSTSTPTSSSSKKRPPDEVKTPSTPSKKLKLSIHDGIDCESGASFAEALGMMMPSTSKKKDTKERKDPQKESSKDREKDRDRREKHKEHKSDKDRDRAGERERYKEKDRSRDREREKEKPREQERSKDRERDRKEKSASSSTLPKALQTPPSKEDLGISNLLPQISTNYKPLGFLPGEAQRGGSAKFNDDEMLSRLMYAKNARTKVYSGNKVFYGVVPTLFDYCIRLLQDNIDTLALGYTGGVPYSILKPVLDRATPSQLFSLEHYNTYLMEDSDELWKLHCQREFKSKLRNEMETWREMYLRCIDERDAKLKSLTANIKLSQDKSVPVRQTKLAYVDTIAKAPRAIAKKQAKNGVVSSSRPAVTPSSRLQQLAMAGGADKIAVPNPGASRVNSSGGGGGQRDSYAVKPKKAPLMAKTLQLMKGRFRR